MMLLSENAFSPEPRLFVPHVRFGNVQIWVPLECLFEQVACTLEGQRIVRQSRRLISEARRAFIVATLVPVACHARWTFTDSLELLRQSTMKFALLFRANLREHGTPDAIVERLGQGQVVETFTPYETGNLQLRQGLIAFSTCPNGEWMMR